MKIGKRKIGVNQPPFIIAEMSGNHNQSKEIALSIVEAAAKSGAHAIKLQTFTADTMTIDCKSSDFLISDNKSLWKGQYLYDLYKEASTPWEWHEEIFQYAKSLGLIAFSTPFDDSSVDFLESLDPPCYKIASFENTDIPLIQRVASTGKPMIISMGMASLGDIERAVSAAKEAGCQNLVLLQCTSTYPADPSNSNVKTLTNMRETFGCEVGLSDHTAGIGVAVASVALGASVIEKHLTLDRRDGGVDAEFSLEPNELQQLAVECDRAWQGIGRVVYGPTTAERKSLKYRRSIFVVRDIVAGEKFSASNLRIIRPGNGLPPSDLRLVIGKTAKQNIKFGTPLSWELIS